MAASKSLITFLSYSREDSEFALRLARDLKSAGSTVWMDQLDITPGDRWDKAVQDALARCERMLVILSPAAVESESVLDEINYALGKRRTVIPVLHRSCDVPYRLGRLQYVDFRQGYEAGRASLLRTLEPEGSDERHAGEVRTNPKDGQPYIWIPPGEFEMGCSRDDAECDSDENPRRAVRLTRGFWLGQMPVTQAAYEKVMGANPSHFRGPLSPVENITWDEGRRYCEAAGGRLPTEAEWEYAARAGSQGARYGNLDEIAWYASNSGGGTHPAGQKQGNAWGLHDMLGNVWEWAADLYRREYYQAAATVDPKGPPAGDSRVWRGGSWYVDASHVRASFRGRGEPGTRLSELGFRCALDAIP